MDLSSDFPCHEAARQIGVTPNTMWTLGPDEMTGILTSFRLRG
jgi:hypothetical protein